LKEKQLQELKQDLIKRNYPTNIIDSGIQRAKIIPQHLLRQTSNKNNNAVIPLITTHNPNNPNVLGTVKAGLTILKSSLRLSNLIDSHRIINSKRQPPNLKKLLTKAKFSSIPITQTITSCGNVRCKCCDVILTGHHVKIGETTFYTNSDMNCLSQNLIYALTCPCGQFYIGETGDRLLDRVRVHRQQSKNKHIINCLSNSKNVFSIFPFTR